MSGLGDSLAMHRQSLLEPSVLIFNFLPSRTLHPSQWDQFDAPPFVQAIEAMPARANLWHRHWSQHILRQTGLHNQWVTDLSHPLLPLALLSPQALAEQARTLGVLLFRPRLQRFIAGQAVRVLQARLGSAFRWIYAAEAPDVAPHDWISDVTFKNAEEASVIVDRWGWQVLHTSFHQADAAILGRVDLKMPRTVLQSLRASEDPAVARIDPDEALTLTLKFLNY